MARTTPIDGKFGEKASHAAEYFNNGSDCFVYDDVHVVTTDGGGEGGSPLFGFFGGVFGTHVTGHEDSVTQVGRRARGVFRVAEEAAHVGENRGVWKLSQFDSLTKVRTFFLN